MVKTNGTSRIINNCISISNRNKMILTIAYFGTINKSTESMKSLIYIYTVEVKVFVSISIYETILMYLYGMESGTQTDSHIFYAFKCTDCDMETFA